MLAVPMGTPTPTDATIGATLGSYRVTAKLGQGGMGAVYLAEHPLLGRKAAVKVLLPELSSHKDSVDRFFHEARTTARLRHPAMVDVFDFGTLPDGRAYLIMDFLEGECLEARVRNGGALSVTESLRIAREIALGVSVAHAEQIVHRDLKPDNIFLMPPVAGNRDERVKILDFGIAKLGRKPGESGAGVGVTRVGAVMGTPLYMSPEQCRGAAEVDGRADIYALGCILFTMLAGRPPFLSESMGELMGLHQLAPAPTLESLGVTVPRSVERLVQNMLAKSPDDRPATMVAVADHIGRILREEGGAGVPWKPFQTVALPSADGDVTTQRGREAAAHAHAHALLDKTTPDPRTEPLGLSPPGGTLDGRSVVRDGSITWSGTASRWPLVVGGAAAVVALSALAIFLVGREPASSGPVRAASAPPAVERARAGGEQANETPRSPAVTTPTPEGQPPAPSASTTRSPSGTGSAVATPPSPTPPAMEAGTPVTGKRPRSSSRKAQARAQLAAPAEPALRQGELKPAATEPVRSKSPRPVYRGTQLQIEKEVPYD